MATSSSTSKNPGRHFLHQEEIVAAAFSEIGLDYHATVVEMPETSAATAFKTLIEANINGATYTPPTVTA